MYLSVYTCYVNIYRHEKVLNECVQTKMSVDSTKLINAFSWK